jgi:hypothetical protein
VIGLNVCGTVLTVGTAKSSVRCLLKILKLRTKKCQRQINKQKRMGKGIGGIEQIEYGKKRKT